MRRIIFLALGLMTGATSTSAQSVLERVLGQIDGASNLAQVNGTYANISESAGGITDTYSENLTSNAPAGTILARVIWGANYEYITLGMVGTTTTLPSSDPLKELRVTVDSSGQVTELIEVDSTTKAPLVVQPVIGLHDAFTSALVTNYTGAPIPLVRTGGFFTVTAFNGWTWYTTEPSLLPLKDTRYAMSVEQVFIPGISTTIDGSITNIVTGVTAATSEAVAGFASATEFNLPTLDLGDMSTTALGAVNTGEITLGVNSAVDEANTSSTRAVSAAITQIGGSADTGALVLNVASNASQVIGSIENTLVAVNGSIGNLSTTALGAVNTGTITSGVNAAVQGIVGMSGQSGL